MVDDINFRVLHNEKVGRYAVAIRELKPGDVILSENPFIYGPKSGTPVVCLGCYAPVDGITLCRQCGWPVCNENCETKPAHKNAECDVFSKCKVRFQPVEDTTAPCPQYECVTPLRLLIAKENNPERWENEIKNMESHNDIRMKLPVWRLNQINVVDFLLKYCKLVGRFDEDLVHIVCGIIEINAFEGRSSAGYSVRIVYPKTALMSHNCISNTTHSITPVNELGVEFRIEVRAACVVPENGELFSSYTSSLNPTIIRREQLKEGKYFDCTCDRCADPTEKTTHMSSMKCQKCDPGLIISTDPLDSLASWKCTNCEFTARGETIIKIFKTIQSEIEMLDYTSVDGQCIEDRERVFRKYKSVLHPRHAYMTTLRQSLSQMYGRIEGYLLNDLPDVLLERKVELCEDLLKTIDIIEPGYSRLRGITLYELHAPLILLARNLKRAGIIDQNSLKKKLEEAILILEEATNILGLEPTNTPDGILGKVALESLQQIKQNMTEIVSNF